VAVLVGGWLLGHASGPQMAIKPMGRKGTVGFTRSGPLTLENSIRQLNLRDSASATASAQLLIFITHHSGPWPGDLRKRMSSLLQ